MEDLPHRSQQSSARPVSRRGGALGSSTIPESMESTPSPIMRPGTSIRGLSARPPSSLRGGTATRLATAMHGPPATSQRIGTAIGAAGNMMTERPLTQHGLSGLPTAHGRIGTATGMRQIKDKRYWEAIIQSKMNEISKETEKLLSEKQSMDRERSAKKTYEKKVKEAAKELTLLQSKLTDMNIVLDSFSSGLSRQQMQQEAAALRERNESVQSQLEALFGERQSKEERNRELEREVSEEKNKVNEMIFTLPEEQQKKYRQLQSLAENLRTKNAQLHDDIENAAAKRDKLNGIVMSSQPRAEAVRLQMKLKELRQKKEMMEKEEANRLSPAQERDKLINEVRANNQALASMGKQLKLVDDQLLEKKDMLLQLEQDLEEGNSERHAKYKELKRRDETMSAFIDNFHENMKKETNIKNKSVYAIEQITLQGINIKSYGMGRSDIIDEKNDLNSHGGLLKEYKRLSIQLKQLQILEKRTASQMTSLKQDEMAALGDIKKYSNLENLRRDAAAQMDELASELEELKNKRRVTEGVLEEATNRNREVKEHLRSNETYRQISHLEEKLSDLIRENRQLEEVNDERRKEFNYADLKQNAEQKLEEFMELLRSEGGFTGF